MFKKVLPKKFADRELDEFIDSVFRNHSSNPNDNYIFDLTAVEFIGNQELLVLSSLFKSFYDSGIKFKVIFFKDGTPTTEINERVKRQIIQFWDVWKIWKIVPQDLIKEYFGIDGNSVQRIQEELRYFPKLSEIYNRHGVTPFVSLDFINNYNENDIQESIDPIYSLNSVIADLINKNKCNHPFTSKSLSTIITEELYLNFLDHSSYSSFTGFDQMAFMSISFQSKLDETKNTQEEIQKIKKLNFQTECLDETKDFFFDKATNKFNNKPYIQFSFLDFGQGIVSTLKEQFSNQRNRETKNFESDILRFAFNYNSSRHPIFHEKNKLEQFIPRGLFDALSIVKRYRGLLVVRSNYGKILFDFSYEKDITKAFSYFGNNKLYFPGTIISLYIPAIENAEQLNVSSIKPETEFATVKPQNKKYLSIDSLLKKIDVSKEELYTILLTELKSKICEGKEHSLVFVSFKGCKIPKRIIKKTIYFLLTDYDVNLKNNVVVLNSPPENITDEIADEILSLNDALKNYKIHPLPIIDFDENREDLKVKWLGIYDNSDKEKLKDLLFEQYSIAKSDFRDPANIIGQLNEFDTYGNLISNFPNRDDIINFFKHENDISFSMQVETLLQKHDSIKKDDCKSLYLCNGNYYQKEYVELSNLLNDKFDCDTVSRLLHDKLKLSIQNINDFKFIGITTTSQRILKSLEMQNLISMDQYDSSLDNYHTFEKDLTEEKVDKTKKYILVCDVISTGYLTQRLNQRLQHYGTNIEYVAVIVSILHPEFKTTESFLNDFKSKIFRLFEFPIAKFERAQLGNDIFSKQIIRINPHTNIPIRLSINETNFNESIAFHTDIKYSETENEITVSNEFLDSISDNAVHVGFYKFNNVIHPYFFNTKHILNDLDETLLKKTFEKINNAGFLTEKIKVFYPRKSSIDEFKFKLLKDVLRNQHIEEIEIERFGTTEGWRFPHNTDYLSAKIVNNFCFILDDGSCSGDSIIQMIDEISFYDAKEIVLLCFIGRVNDHKREFFSRLSQIRVKNGKLIPISIYFFCHWHIPTYYLDENPNTKETNWLEQIIRLPNTPQSIKKIASSILREIKPKEENTFTDHKYLPRKKGTNEIPKKELLMIREELGKVIGYRLYKESFIYFDYFIKKYQKPIKNDKYFQDIELLCAAFIYEPYLYENIINVLPDVTERIENFVSELIFSKENKIYPQLTYDWKEKDILHLFFIVFKNEKLIEKLGDIEKFKKLIEFNQKKDSNIIYILYNLLKYFPLTTSEFNDKKYDIKIRQFIKNFRDDGNIYSKEVNKYFNFINSLPSRDDFESQIVFLVENYNKQKEPEYHLDKISFDHNVSYILALLRDSSSNIDAGKMLENEKIQLIKERWFEILNFITPILSFSIRFKEFLSPFPYFRLIHKVESGDTSLRMMVGFNEDVIFSLNESFNDIEKLKTVEKNIVRIQTDFKVNSDFYKLINKRQSCLSTLTIGLQSEILSLSKTVEVFGEELIKPEYLINIPEVYSEILIQKELTINMKNHSKNENNAKVTINYSLISDTELEMKISNAISEQAFNNSNGEGIKCLNLLSDSALFDFKYQSKKVDTNFIQTLTFKIQKNGYEKN
jgi:hypothetical protein